MKTLSLVLAAMCLNQAASVSLTQTSDSVTDSAPIEPEQDIVYRDYAWDHIFTEEELGEEYKRFMELFKGTRYTTLRYNLKKMFTESFVYRDCMEREWCSRELPNEMQEFVDALKKKALLIKQLEEQNTSLLMELWLQTNGMTKQEYED